MAKSFRRGSLPSAVVLFGMIAAPGGFAYAQDRGAPTTASAQSPASPEIVVTAVEHPPLNATFTEGVVSSATLRNLSPSPTVTVQTLLNREPSIFAFTSGPFGVETSIFFRAFNSGQFSETFDGVALNDVFNANVTGGAENVNNVLLTTDDIDSIQVYHGVNNPAVNSYNSLGGTVNFTPRRPSEQFGAEIEADYGSFNTFQYHARLDTGAHHGFKEVLSFNYGSTDGWLQNTSDRNYNVYYAATYDGADNRQLGLTFVYNHNQGFPPNEMPTALLDQFGHNYQWPTDVYYHAITNNNLFGILNVSTPVASNITFTNKVFAGYDEYLRTSFSNPADVQSSTQPYFLDDGASGSAFWLPSLTYDPTAIFGSPQLGTDYHFYGYTAYGVGDTPTLEIELPHNKLTVGANLTHAWLHSREYWYGATDMPMIPGYNDAWEEWDNRTFASAYVQDEISLLSDRLIVTPGVKYIYVRTNDSERLGFYYSLPGSVADTEQFVSPTIGASFKPIDSVDIYGAFGQNVKFPDISSYYGAFQTNGSTGMPVIVPVNIKPEHVNDYELGVRYEKGGFYGSVSVYREDFQDIFLTTSDPATSLSSTQNGGTALFQGVELQVSDEFGHALGGDWTGYFSYAHNDAKYTSAFTTDFGMPVAAGQPITNVPQDLISASLVWTSNGWRANLNVRYVGQQFVNDSFNNPTTSTISPYATVDLGVSKTIPLQGVDGPTNMRVFFNVDNVTNAYYFSQAQLDLDISGNPFIRAIPAAPRSFTGGVAVDF